MKKIEYNIKGMVCSRCLKVLHEELEALGATILKIQLGRILLEYIPEDITTQQFESVFKENEFEIIRDVPTLLAEETKREIHEYVWKSDHGVNLSDFLSTRLKRNYDGISKNFTNIYGRTIERYSLIIKVERAKELLEIGELNMSEIAYSLGYQNPSALSRQFKKETGMTLNSYRQLEKRERIPVDKI